MNKQADYIIARLRLPPELRDKIAESAETYNRSMNADMVARLEQSFESHQFEDIVEKIPTEVLMLELASRMKGYSLTVEEIEKLKE